MLCLSLVKNEGVGQPWKEISWFFLALCFVVLSTKLAWLQQEQKEWKYEGVKGRIRSKEKDMDIWFQKWTFLEIFYLRRTVEGGYDASLSFPTQEVKLKFYFSIIGAFFESISKYMQVKLIVHSFLFILTALWCTSFLAAISILLFSFFSCLRSICWHAFSLRDYDFLRGASVSYSLFLLPSLAPRNLSPIRYSFVDWMNKWMNKWMIDKGRNRMGCFRVVESNI